MANIKTSQSRDNGGLKFSLASKDIESESGVLLKDIGYIECAEAHNMSADDVLDANGSDTPHLDNARYWFIWITVRGVSKEC